MAYTIIIRCDGEDIASVPPPESLASAKQLAEGLLTEKDAYSVRLIDADGSVAEVASMNRDGKVWDDE